jgi:hypothetical protein
MALRGLLWGSEGLVAMGGERSENVRMLDRPDVLRLETENDAMQCDDG